MERLSSNLTLFFKLTVPVGWVSFFGLFAVVILLVDTTDKPLLASTYFRYGFLAFFLIFLTIIYFTIYQLKRVEQEGEFLFVTDYFKTIKFSIENIEKVSTLNMILFKIVWFHLKVKGRFGKRIPFLAKKSSFKSFEINNPSLF